MKVTVFLLAALAAVCAENTYSTQAPYAQPSYGQPPYGQPPYGQPSYGQQAYSLPSLDKLKKDVEYLEQNVRDVEKTLGTVRTLNQAGQDKINFLVDVFLPKISLMNQQQDARAASYAAQLKAIQLRLDKDEANADEALVWAQNTEEQLGLLALFLEQNIKADNNAQDDAIKTLNGDVEDFKQEVLGNLDYNIQELNGELDQVRDDLHPLIDFVEDRKCEYGVGSFNPDESKFVYFVTAFTEVPAVTLFTTGFTSDLDEYNQQYNDQYNGKQYNDQYNGKQYNDKQYNNNDYHNTLSLNAFVSQVNTTGFVVSAVDKSEGSVDVNYIFTSWAACQKLTGDVPYKFPSKGKPY